MTSTTHPAADPAGLVAQVHIPRLADAPGSDDHIPLRRLVTVELRKAVDTRSGRWLLALIAGGTAAVMAIVVVFGISEDLAFTLSDVFQIANLFPMGVLLPVLGVLSVTSEWSQRTNVVTFGHVPRRGRIITAKLLAGVVTALAAAAAALAFGVVALGVLDLLGGSAAWAISAEVLGAFALLQTINLLTGFAFGLLLLSTPASLVVFFAYYFVLPTASGAAAGAWDWAESVLAWIDFNRAQLALTDGSLDGLDWPQLATAAAIWLVAPVALGTRRVLGAEIK
ncbi:MAG: ABC transporter permease [Actinomycetota bacterium]|nr:ABC transporter permease [Actinomycetota bacterium]